MKRIALGLVALVVTAGLAWGAGQFDDFPTVGLGSFCQGTSTGATGNQVCTTTVPAGPQYITAGMTVPADTNFANGAQPQTVQIPMALIGDLAPTIVTPTNATTVTVAATTGTLILTPATVLTTLGIQLPAASAMIEGQKISVSSTQTLSAVTWGAGTGNTISNTPTILTVSTTGAYGFQMVFHALTYANSVPATGIWYRVQ
jgi:hypothetical protein